VFPEGGWFEVKRLAGLERHPKDNKPLSDNDLLTEYHRIATHLGDVPTWPVFASRASFSPETIRKRFGGLHGVLRRYAKRLEHNDPKSPLVEILAARSKHEIPPPPRLAIPTKSSGSFAWAKIQGTEFGAPIDFRGLRHAPINEQGVVFLFGMMSYEMGFIVEAIHTSFLDCEAKRCIDRRANRLHRVNIEFDYKSCPFRDHGHDSAKCDLIVCWEHNLPYCPLEVVELRTVLDQLEG
jgi:hypothetical protein